MNRGALSKTITLRLKTSLRMKVARRARERGTTSSDLIRSILEQALSEARDEEDQPTLLERTRSIVGSVSSTRVRPGRDARRSLGAWDPDRRG